MIGTSLHRYEILEELGQGGMSVVYRGHDPDLDRDVAVKVLHDHLAAKEANRERFRREAKAIARLDHPRILDVHDFSEADDEHAYIVMEYVPGQTLRERLDAWGPPPPEVAAMIGLAIADALDHAHDHGVIHRDLKPENVMVSDQGIVKLMDFGIAHVVDAETMTQTGNLLGSPAHMAPEIIDGREVNPRSDIFSLGTVLYWLSTGSFPFQGDNPSHLLREVLKCNYDDPTVVEPRLGRDLGQIIDRCLLRDPDERFESVTALATSLRDAIEVIEVSNLDEELASYFRAPASYVEDFESVVVERLVDRGHEAMERGAVPEAMAYYDRVLAYDPGNEEVTGQLERLDRERTRRHWLVIGAIAVILLATGVGTYWYLTLRDQSTRGLGPSRPTVDEAVVEARATSHERAAETRSRSIGHQIASRARASIASRRGIAAARDCQIEARHVVERAETKDASVAPTRVVSNRSPRDDDSSPPPSDAPDDQSPEPSPPSSDASETSRSSDAEERELYTYRFQVQPLAATVVVGDASMPAPRAARQGFDLPPGRHKLRVVSARCHPREQTLRVDGPQSTPRSLALDWKDARIQIDTNRPAVVYLDGNRSEPYPIGADGNNASIRIPFGRADSDRGSSRMRLRLEIRPRDNLQLKRQHSVVLRPGEQTSISVNFL